MPARRTSGLTSWRRSQLFDSAHAKRRIEACLGGHEREREITAHFIDQVTLEPKTFDREFAVAGLIDTASPRTVKAQALNRSLDALHEIALCDDSAIDQAMEVLQDAMSQIPDDMDLLALAMQVTKPLGNWEMQ